MTLDEAIKHVREVAEDKRADADWKFRHGRLNADDCISCAEEHEQLAEWLEELKNYRETNFNYVQLMDCRYRDGYRKAIDDFVKNINKCSGWTPNCIESSHDICLTIYTLNQIAEHLKECAE